MRRFSDGQSGVTVAAALRITAKRCEYNAKAVRLASPTSAPHRQWLSTPKQGLRDALPEAQAHPNLRAKDEWQGRAPSKDQHPQMGLCQGLPRPSRTHPRQASMAKRLKHGRPALYFRRKAFPQPNRTEQRPWQQQLARSGGGTGAATGARQTAAEQKDRRSRQQHSHSEAQGHGGKRCGGDG